MKNRQLTKIIVLACFTLAAVASAEVNLGFNGVGGHIGLAMPEGSIGNPIAFGANFDFGTLMDNLHLTGLASYWSKGWAEGFSTSSLTIAAIAQYFFGDPGAQILPFAGAGLGLNITSTTVEWFGEKSSSSATDLGIHLQGGIHYVLSEAMKLMAYAQYSLSGWDYFGIYGGLLFNLNK
ncbi:MAG TPA: hypothetical protein ENN03_01150 [bacterium]|nr:hypothetical protein [bacterium]